MAEILKLKDTVQDLVAKFESLSATVAVLESKVTVKRSDSLLAQAAAAYAESAAVVQQDSEPEPEPEAVVAPVEEEKKSPEEEDEE